MIPQANLLEWKDNAPLNLTNSTWEKEVGYKYKNDDEFMSVVKMNYPEIYGYLDALRIYCKQK